MVASPFAAGLELVPSPGVESPVKSHARGPSIAELDAIELPDYGQLSGTHPPNVAVTPETLRTSPGDYTPGADNSLALKTPNDLEQSQPPTPRREGAATIVPSWFYPAMNKWRVLSACCEYFGNGMNDAASGALIPYLESYYNIGYAIVSLIFITNAAGFILSAFLNDAIESRLGRAKTLVLSEICMIAGYTMIVCSPPFAVVVVAYLILGFGEAMNLALNNVFCSNLAKPTVVLGAAHGSYGVGGIVGPVIATSLAANGVLWSRFFLITLGVRIIALLFTGWSFWNYEKEKTHYFADSLQRLASQQVPAESAVDSKLKLLGRALKNKTTIIGAIFIFAYQGAEVAESGWFITYLISYRGGDPAKVGYVTSGFWAGITLGRFTLTHVAHRFGETRFVFILGVGTLAFQVLAWLVPNIIGDAVAVAVLGLLLGPVYPCGSTVFTRLLPSNIQMTAISFISSAGSSGGAVVPFLTGLIAQQVGTFVLHPICIASFVLMLGCWAALPRVVKRTE